MKDCKWIFLLIFNVFFRLHLLQKRLVPEVGAMLVIILHWIVFSTFCKWFRDSTCPVVMTILDMWAKSMCHPLEKLVDVEQEFPEEVGYKFSPPCVPLKRCSGCCQDERQECQPTLERNVTVEVIRILITKANVKNVLLTLNICS